MDVSRQKKRVRARVLVSIAGVVGVFVLLQSRSLLHRHPPGYLEQPPVGEFSALSWPELQRASWIYGHEPVVPKGVTELEGKPVKLRGFLLPLHSARLAVLPVQHPGRLLFLQPARDQQRHPAQPGGGQRVGPDRRGSGSLRYLPRSHGRTDRSRPVLDGRCSAGSLLVPGEQIRGRTGRVRAVRPRSFHLVPAQSSGR